MKNIKALFRIIGQLNYIITEKQKKGAVTVFVTMIVCSFIELISVSVIYPFLQLMLDRDAAKSKWYINWIYKLYPDFPFSGVIIVMCLGIIAIYLLKNGVALLCAYKQNKYAVTFQRELTTTMLSSFMKQPYEYFVNTNSAWIKKCLI